MWKKHEGKRLEILNMGCILIMNQEFNESQFSMSEEISGTEAFPQTIADYTDTLRI